MELYGTFTRVWLRLYRAGLPRFILINTLQQQNLCVFFGPIVFQIFVQCNVGKLSSERESCKRRETPRFRRDFFLTD